MALRHGFENLALSDEGRRDAPILSDTFWGYVMRPTERQLERAALIEIAACFTGILVLAQACGNWLLPWAGMGTLAGPQVLSSAALAVLGLVLVWCGRSGLAREVHVDRAKSELRLVQRNRHGAGRLTEQVAFGDVASVLVATTGVPGQAARLALRLSGGRRIDLADACESVLIPLRDRLAADLSPRFRANPAHMTRPAVRQLAYQPAIRPANK